MPCRVTISASRLYTDLLKKSSTVISKGPSTPWCSVEGLVPSTVGIRSAKSSLLVCLASSEMCCFVVRTIPARAGETCNLCVCAIALPSDPWKGVGSSKTKSPHLLWVGSAAFLSHGSWIQRISGWADWERWRSPWGCLCPCWSPPLPLRELVAADVQ